MSERQGRLSGPRVLNILVISPFFIEPEKAVSAALRIRESFPGGTVTLIGDREDFLPGKLNSPAQPAAEAGKIVLCKPIGSWFGRIRWLRQKRFDLAVVLSAPLPGTFRRKAALILAAVFMGIRKIALCEIVGQDAIGERPAADDESAFLNRAGLAVRAMIRPKDFVRNAALFPLTVLILVLLAIFFTIFVGLRTRLNRLRWRAASE